MGKQGYSIDELARITGLSPSAIRALGKNAVINQHLAKHGIPAAINCEDSRVAGGYTGDAEKDLKRIEGRRG